MYCEKNEFYEKSRFGYLSAQKRAFLPNFSPKSPDKWRNIGDSHDLPIPEL